ncbi:bifunctional diaminohydroxyphosphoribosylaminopyrimidine deaminase/5-amino-6-(5-phosphoribosylamino)uracil reductase RibD [Marivirga arenosa]|uniref:Riboflavin biosynthesis protein RibD n=1 Tax=Marivirga arenosa TaxID=3059076 RepID=A0AA51N570_9BACT|nr:bifunctional diaminohydroxyphosphoribosylaminopyrimidine deaminase/5-amino-6-(5-phosphoribosylamino)uracil reductase RibD [Marivirga sp. ABR2-2]WMN06194.1 bifunctional diaminohydroxyphosphoribosylaminopyrimidine deaminase/5-amino-6-(5-phosphoribosylamino)uracil reductase RibD [Marivirga sp. ABR2-2]
MMSKQDEIFMQRALQLASYGRPTVSPNPMVGCVIVLEGKIIGEGWHQKAGEPHAEVLAIRNVKDHELLKRATAYVTLEPCAHYGKTPPCAELLVEKQLKKVVIGCLDPNPLVAGKGVKILEDAGIEVVCDVLKEESLNINKQFFTFFQKKRPYIVLKWAETADGFVARENFDSKWISNGLSRQLVHKWRTELDSILVGKNTVIYDNPKLNARDWPGKNPIRIVIDHKLEVDQEKFLYSDGLNTICFHSSEKEIMDSQSCKFIQLSQKEFLSDLLGYLYQNKIQSVLVEGGAQTLESFIKAELWDEARVFKSSNRFGSGIKSPQLKDGVLVSQQNIKDHNQVDTLFIYRIIKIN